MNYKRLTPHLVQLTTVDSTNNYAAKLLKATKVANGTVVMTKRQTEGRGQTGNVWETEADKNLILSLILYPEISVNHIFNLTIVASLAVQKTLAVYLNNVKIKWPNDILVNEKKIAGILIENQLRGDLVLSSIVGIGINVNQENFVSTKNACSLKSLLNQDIDLNEFFNLLYTNLDFYVNLLMEKNFKTLLQRYYENLYGINQELIYEDNTGQFNGTIKGISDSGKLMLMRDNILVHYDLKEIRFVF